MPLEDTMRIMAPVFIAPMRIFNGGYITRLCQMNFAQSVYVHKKGINTYFTGNFFCYRSKYSFNMLFYSISIPIPWYYILFSFAINVGIPIMVIILAILKHVDNIERMITIIGIPTLIAK